MTTTTETTFTAGQAITVNGRDAEYVGPASCGCCQHIVKYVGNDYHDYATMSDTVVAKATEPRPFQAGDKVRLKRNIGGTQGYTGQVGTLEQHPSVAGVLGFRPEGCTEGGAYGGGLYGMAGYNLDTSVELIEPAAEPTVASGDLADALRRAERAENALQAFRDQVRQAVIDEAAEQGWCDRTDSWLESIGLEPREPETEDVEVTVIVRVPMSREIPNGADVCEYIDSDDVYEAVRESRYSLDYDIQHD